MLDEKMISMLDIVHLHVSVSDWTKGQSTWFQRRVTIQGRRSSHTIMICLSSVRTI